jgi:anaerobic sulfite reductase subunit B
MRSWDSAVLRERRFVDDGLFHLTLEVAPRTRAGFERPGQFNRIRTNGFESAFAIASSPGESRFDYLVRRGTHVSDALATAALDSAFEVSLPEGRGFPLESAVDRDLLLVATGTALAPVRSVLRAIAPTRSRYKAVTLLQGQRSPRQLPWIEELSALSDVVVKTIVAESTPTWQGPIGLVQTLVPASTTDQTVAFLVGQREMTDDVTTLLLSAGVPRERIFLNV